ncbi:mediator complex subunit Med15 [Bulinus truncatus]|nr:mediator complex subunit Med15 [Bulinus truncatus]
MMQGMGGQMVGQQQPHQRIMDIRSQHMQNPRAQMMMPRVPGMQRQDAFLVTSPQNMQGVQGQSLPTSSVGQMPYQGTSGPIRNMGPMNMTGQYMQARDMGMTGLPAQSPVQNSPLTMIPSPHVAMPSPVIRNYMNAPSPNTALHTPGTAVSDPSPGPPSTSLEEQEYIRKLDKLSRYIEPLRKFVMESEKKSDEESKRNHKKMKSLLDILSNPKKRVPIGVLEKCEQVLQKLTNGTNLPSAHGHMCQPLLDAIAHFSTASYLNHSLHRTFGPALEAYRGASLIKAPSPPVSRKRKEEKEKPDELPDILQGEIARLGHRFIVSVDPRHHPGSESHHLVCKLEDVSLPSVPPLHVSIPRTYPKSSPRCDPSSCPGYGHTGLSYREGAWGLLEIPPYVLLEIPPYVLIEIPPYVLLEIPPYVLLEIPPYVLLEIPPYVLLEIPPFVLLVIPPYVLLEIPPYALLGIPPYVLLEIPPYVLLEIPPYVLLEIPLYVLLEIPP